LVIPFCLEVAQERHYITTKNQLPKPIGEIFYDGFIWSAALISALVDDRMRGGAFGGGSKCWCKSFKCQEDKAPPRTPQSTNAERATHSKYGLKIRVF